MTPVTSSSLVPTLTSNESHARSDGLRSFQIRSPTSLTLVPTSSALVPNSPPTSLTLVSTSFALVPDTQSNESHTRFDELRARSKFTIQRVLFRFDELPARSRDSSTSFPLAHRQSRQDQRTRDALFTRAPPNNKDTRIQQCPLPCLPCICVQRATLFS